jgi:hypothetical protein
MHEFFQAWGYWLWGVGTLMMAAVIAWTYASYRRGVAGREQGEVERRSARWRPR